jgi:exosortase B
VVTIPTHKKLDLLAPWLIVLIGILAMYVPTFWDLSQGLWRQEDHLQGPIILVVSLWLLYQKWPAIRDNAPPSAPPIFAWPLLIFACLLYVLGRSQDILILEVSSFIGVLTGIALLLRGTAALKRMWFPLFFMLFMLPLPGIFVEALTQPMRIVVSRVVESLLFLMGYPIARSGVVLQIGQYQLFVADACAGLHTLFTLEALGLLYLNLVRHESPLRNVILTLLIIPISFTANVIRVMALTLITYHFGDEAGQGFLHGFAGMVLFLSALLLILFCDSALNVVFKGRSSAAA